MGYADKTLLKRLYGEREMLHGCVGVGGKGGSTGHIKASKSDPVGKGLGDISEGWKWNMSGNGHHGC